MNWKTCGFTAAVSAILLVCGCASLQDMFKVERPTATLQGVKIGKIGLQSTELLFDVEIQNPYTVDLPLKALSYDVRSGDKVLFSGTADIEQPIPSKNKAIVALPIKVSYVDVVKAFSSFKTGGSLPYTAAAGLSVDAPALGLITLPMTRTGQLTVPSLK